jgi:LPS sulfotransferase NodH
MDITDPTAPRPSFVCATPRSGSTLVCEALAQTGVEPFTILYEELVRTWSDTLRRTLRFLEIPGADALQLPEPPLQRQSGDRSRAWVERFAAEPSRAVA